MPVPSRLIATPAQDSSIEIVPDFFVPVSTGQISPAIYPGQPISLRWHYAGLIAAIQPSAKIVASVLSKDRSTVVASSSALYVDGGVSEQIDGISSSDPEVYRLGEANEFILQAQVDTIDASLAESSATFAVVEEFLAAGLEWDIASATDEFRVPGFFWKQPYTIAAVFKNISQWITLSGTATLMEGTAAIGPWTNRGTVPVQLGPGRSTPLTFQERKQEWGWFAPGVWVIYGDLYRPFFYTVQFQLADNFGNTYSFKTAVARIAVTVSERKFALATAAMAAMAIALMLYLISWLVTPAPAATVQGIAAGLGGAALDPPKPSKRFDERVSLPKRRLADLGPKLTELADVMSETDLIARLDKALYKIESRILGARDANNREAMIAQFEAYEEATRALNKSVARLSVAIDHALAWLQNDKRDYDVKTRAALAALGRGDVDQLKLSKKSRQVLKQLAEAPRLVSASMEGMGSKLLDIRSAMLSAARFAAKDRLRVERDYLGEPRKRPSSKR